MSMTVEALAEELGRIHDAHASATDGHTEVAELLLPFIERHIAAGRADAVPALDSVLRERGLPTVADALGYSRNFAAANPALSQTTRDHIEGLCNMLEIAANHPAPAPQPMTTQGEAVAYTVTHVQSCVAVGYYLLEIKTDNPPKVGMKLYTGPQS